MLVAWVLRILLAPGARRRRSVIELGRHYATLFRQMLLVQLSLLLVLLFLIIAEQVVVVVNGDVVPLGRSMHYADGELG